MSMNTANADGNPKGVPGGEPPTAAHAAPPAGPPPSGIVSGPPAAHAAPPGGAQNRTRQFTADVGNLKLRAPKTALDTQLMWLGVALMVVGIGIGIGAYIMSHNTTLDLTQRDAIVAALSGIPVSIAGLALFLRYSLSSFLRFWLARLIAAQQAVPPAAAPAPVRGTDDATTVLPAVPPAN